jgi:hypothetical protein
VSQTILTVPPSALARSQIADDFVEGNLVLESSDDWRKGEESPDAVILLRGGPEAIREAGWRAIKS